MAQPTGISLVTRGYFPGGSLGLATDGRWSDPGAEAALLQITVRDLETGLPVSGALVVIEEEVSAYTDGDGLVEFNVLADGTYTWHAWAEGYLVAWDGGTADEAHTTWLAPEATASAVPYCYDDPACSGETAEHDPNDCYPAITALALAEDLDGIPPDAVNLSSDRTPTVTWEASGGIAPYLYLWELRSADGVTVLYSGSTASTRVTLPELEYGLWHFRVHVNDGRGRCSLWSDFEFELAPHEPDIEIDPPPDLEPLEPLGLAPIRYLPQWLSLYGTADTPASGSTFYQFWQPHLKAWERWNRTADQLLDQSSLLDAPIALPRLAWYLPTRFQADEALRVVVRLGGEETAITGVVRPAISEYDFLTSFDPVYLRGAGGQLVFRNLSRRDRTITPDGEGVYHLAGETDGLVRDADLLVQKDGIWYRLPVDSGGVNARDAELLLPGGFSGPYLIAYLSEQYSTDLEVSLNGEPYQVPHRFDLWNRFDELGLLAGFNPSELGGRRAGEDNAAFRTRIRARFLARSGTDAAAVVQQLGPDLALADVLEWDGLSTLSLAASGYFGVRDVRVVGLPEIATREEELLSTGTAGQYMASLKDWEPGYLLAIDGRPVDAALYPSLAVSGYLVDFGTEITGRVFAHYRAPHYTLTRSEGDFVTAVVPVSGNLPPGSYRVLLTKGARVFNLADPDYIETELLDAAGRPNGYYRELQRRLAEGSRVHLGQAVWGDAYWFADEERRPPVSYLPAVYDQVEDA